MGHGRPGSQYVPPLRDAGQLHLENDTSNRDPHTELAAHQRPSCVNWAEGFLDSHFSPEIDIELMCHRSHYYLRSQDSSNCPFQISTSVLRLEIQLIRSTVLDAPNLRDDFYCSVLAYSSTCHTLAVGLGSCKFIYTRPMTIPECYLPSFLLGIKVVPTNCLLSTSHLFVDTETLTCPGSALRLV
jgi:hypothetical protein